jgi:minor extracellular serine protease Vpr
VTRHVRLVFVVAISALMLAQPAIVGAREPRVNLSENLAALRRIDDATLAKLRAVAGKLGPGSHAPSKQRVPVIVELTGRPVAQYDAAALAGGTRLAQARREQIARDVAGGQRMVRRQIEALGGRIIATYQHALNGLRLTIPANRLARLARLPGVEHVWSVPRMEPDLVNTNNYVQAPATWTATGKTGNGVTIAVIDTGIDYFHADFGGSGDPDDYNDANPKNDGADFPTAKVVDGFDLVGDDYQAGVAHHDVAHPDLDPLDCNGHGTHVSGIAAGFGVARAPNGSKATYRGAYSQSAFGATDWVVAPGMAPRAKIVALKVFGCEGATDYVVDAIDMAVAMGGIDVINMSLGSVFDEGTDATAAAVDNATDAGIIVVGSAGNSGPSAYIHGGVTTGDKGIAVAALDAVPTIPRASLVISADNKPTGYNMNGYQELPVSRRLTVLRDGSDVSIGCEASDWAGFPAGRIAAIMRGTCPFVTKGELAEEAGAIGVVVVNQNPGGPPPSLGGPQPEFSIPMLGLPLNNLSRVTDADGQMVTLADANPVANDDYRYLAYFTSGGPRTGDSALKPDLAAPGVNVLSAGMGSGTAGVAFSGTSMASPTVAGIAALVREAHPGYSALDVKAALMGTALADSAHFHAGQYDVRLAGAGTVNALRATQATAFARTGIGASLSYGYDPLSGAFNESRSFKLVNNTSNPITYALSVDWDSRYHADLTLTPNSIVVPAHSSRTVNATLSFTATRAANLPSSFVGEKLAATSPSSPIIVYQPVPSVQGAVVARPTASAKGVYALRVPFLAVPRGTSAVSFTNRSDYTVGGKPKFTADVYNAGVHSGFADIYAWGLTDGREGLRAIDIRDAGVQSFDCSGFDALQCDEEDRFINFAVNVYGRWSNLSTEEFDVMIDVNSDRRPDFAVFNVDYGVVFLGDFDGTQLTLTCSVNGLGQCDGDLLEGFFSGGQPVNGSTLTLPTVAHWLGLEAADGHFDYGLESYNVVPSNYVVWDAVLTPSKDLRFAPWNPWHPAVNQGAYFKLAPGANEEQEFRVYPGNLSNEGAPKGWLIVTLNDANGAAQATEVPLGTLP